MKIKDRIDKLQREIDTLKKVEQFAEKHKLTGTDVKFLYHDFVNQYGEVIGQQSFLRLISESYELKRVQTTICGRRCYVYESKRISSTDQKM